MERLDSLLLACRFHAVEGYVIDLQVYKFVLKMLFSLTMSLLRATLASRK